MLHVFSIFLFFLFIPSIAKNKFLVLVLTSGNFDKNKKHRIMVFGSFFLAFSRMNL